MSIYKNHPDYFFSGTFTLDNGMDRFVPNTTESRQYIGINRNCFYSSGGILDPKGA